MTPQDNMTKLSLIIVNALTSANTTSGSFTLSQWNQNTSTMEDRDSTLFKVKKLQEIRDAGFTISPTITFNLTITDNVSWSVNL